MSSKYENESFLSTGSNKYYERENGSMLQKEEDVDYINSIRMNKYNYDKKNKYYEQLFCKKRNKKWNYFMIFFLGACLGFAIWPFFMTVITYKLFYTNSSNHPNYKTNNTSTSLNTYRNDKNKKNDTIVPTKNQPPKNVSPHFKPVKFEEIAGIDESKIELLEVVDFIKNREKYQQMGARMPKGVLLVGPPGSGKTMLARAVATEANAPYIYTSGPEFIEVYVGQGAKRIRQLFSHARSVAPSIVFIDEIDAIGGKRSSGSINGSGQREHDQTLNQLLVEMDGFNNSVKIMVIGATNRIDTIDNALLRPGRFDRIIYVPLPDVNGRKKILEIYIKKIKSDLSIKDIDKIARLTPGFSGADLENVVNEATILATRNKKSLVTVNELFEARDKVSMGPERKSLRQSEYQRRITAYHEAGHAIVAYFLHPRTDPIHKATIISRGNALGYVEQIPNEERHNYFKNQMEAKLAVCMGGRTAEELVFGKSEMSSGASSDISTATEIAYKMVTEWGMSDKLGPLNYKKRMGDGYSSNRLSAKTITTIEAEVKNLIEKSKTLSEEILRKHRSQLDNLAFALLDKETLSGEEIKNIIDLNNSKNDSNEYPDASKDSKNDKLGNDKLDGKDVISSGDDKIMHNYTQKKYDNAKHEQNNEPIENQMRVSSENGKINSDEYKKETHKNGTKTDINEKVNEETNKEESIRSSKELSQHVKSPTEINDNYYGNKNKIELNATQKKDSDINLVITDDKNEIIDRSKDRKRLINKKTNDGKNEKYRINIDKNKANDIKENIRNDIKKIKTQYSKNSNKKDKKLLKTINEHKTFKDKQINNEKVENDKKELDKSYQNNSKKFNYKNNNNNIVENMNELYAVKFPEDGHNDKDFVKTKDPAFNEFIDLIDTSKIKNVEEMKKFNIFEHNLNKLFIFDIFRN